MLQQDQPNDFVIATGEQHSVRDFVREAARALGITVEFTGKGLEEKGIVSSIDKAYFGTLLPNTYSHLKLDTGQTIVAVDPAYFRPTEVETLLGDASKAHDLLGWRPRTAFPDMVKEMTQEDLILAARDALCLHYGFNILRSSE